MSYISFASLRRVGVANRLQLFPVMTLLGVLCGQLHAGPVPLWNGVTSDGSLTVTVDDFGSHADTFQGGPQWLDLFDPSRDPIEGELPENFPTFATYLFFFIDPSDTGDGTHRGVASAHGGILAAYDDGNVNCVVTLPNTTDNLPTSTESAFSCTGPGVAFDVELTQTIGALPTGPDGAATAVLEQNYAVTNTGDAAVELILVKHIDTDMPWAGGGGFFLDDVVGVEFAEFVRPQVFTRDDGLVTAYLTLRTAEDMWLDPSTVDFVYYAGKQSVTPPPNPYYPQGRCPVYDFGTDFQIWDNYGAPNCWKNNIPGLGHDAPGESPDLMGDAFIGMQVEFRLPVGDPHDVTFVTQYGRGPQDAPPQIMHERGRPGQTRPFSGFIDPARESNNGVDLNEGLQEAFIRFSDHVVDFDGSPVDVDSFTLFETGGNNPPQVTTVEDANPPHNVYFRVAWDRPITLQEWITVVATVENEAGMPVVNQGDQGPGVDEPDRVDYAFLPADINQSGIVTPLDLLTFKQFANAVDGSEVVFGLLEDHVDLNRDGTFNPLDLLTFKQLINGLPLGLPPWAFESLNHPRP